MEAGLVHLAEDGRGEAVAQAGQQLLVMALEDGAAALELFLDLLAQDV